MLIILQALNWWMPKLMLLVGFLLIFMCSGVKAIDLRTHTLDPSLDLANINENNTYPILRPRYDLNMCQSRETCLLIDREKKNRQICFNKPRSGFQYACFSNLKDGKSYEIYAPIKNCAEGMFYFF